VNADIMVLRRGANFVAKVVEEIGVSRRGDPLNVVRRSLAARSARSGGSDPLELTPGTQPQRD
jgi:hypothetical protein